MLCFITSFGVVLTKEKMLKRYVGKIFNLYLIDVVLGDAVVASWLPI